MPLSNAQRSVNDAIIHYGESNGYSDSEIQYAVNAAYIESSLGVNLNNPETTASGLYQYTDGTWSDWHSDLGDKDDQGHQIEAIFDDIDRYTERFNDLDQQDRGDLTFEEYAYVKHHDGSNYEDIQNGPGRHCCLIVLNKG